MRGTIGAIVRTVLFVGGFVLLLGGIVTLAFPQLLTTVLFEQAQPAQPERQSLGGIAGSGGPTLRVSMGAIVVGMSTVATGLAIPGRSPLRLVPEQSFTLGQRLYTLVGVFLFLCFPPLTWVATRDFGITPVLYFASLPLALVGVLLLVLGTVRGLQYRPQSR